MDRHAAQTFVDKFLAEPPEWLVPPVEEVAPDVRRLEGFSPFALDQVLEARDAAVDLMRTADAADDPDAAWEAVAEQAQALADEGSVALAQHAMKVFVTHHPIADDVHIRPLEARAPRKTLPSAAAFDDALVEAPDPADPETALAWFREDPEANEHHDHWHVVYPTGGLSETGAPGSFRLQDRQGELFVYMHRQMLARYDHERVALGLDRVEPFGAYDGPVEPGYDPRPGLSGFPPEWAAGDEQVRRSPGNRMPERIDLGAPGQPFIVERSGLAAQDAAFEEDVAAGTLVQGDGGRFPMTIDALGHALEPSRLVGRPDQSPPGAPHPGRYRNFHGWGHLFLGLAGDDPGAGVMIDTDTAIRDPIFWRWHRHIDDFAKAWEDKQDEHPHDAWAAPVEFRRSGDTAADRPAESPDLVLLYEDQLPGDLGDGGLEGWAERTYGGERIDEPFGATDVSTDTLETAMHERDLRFDAALGDVPAVRIRYLDQRPFACAVRLRNDGEADVDVTLRLFLVADRLFDDRRQWIELDKWRQPLPAGQRAVAVRRASESAVIRKPASKPPGELRHSPPRPQPGQPRPYDEASYCECGWPYNLLLPRGTREGMPFWLIAVATDWSQDGVQHSECGSMSFCGAKDRYPDLRPMGYPFDRPVRGGPLAICGWPHVAARRLTVRWTEADGWPPVG